MLFPMLHTADWLHLHLVLYYIFSTEYHNSTQNIKILFWKYLFDSRSEDLFWEYTNGELFAAGETHLWTFASQINDAEQLILTIENKPLLPLWLTGW
jgi:hypothetical protein